MMEIQIFTSADSYLEADFSEYNPKDSKFLSLKGRWTIFKIFSKRLLILPFALCYKLIKTSFCLPLFLLGLFLFLLTFGCSQTQKEFFIRQVRALAKEAADWIFLPFAVAVSFFRMLFAMVFHPRIYFGV
jgi:hypothetical protein